MMDMESWRSATASRADSKARRDDALRGGEVSVQNAVQTTPPPRLHRNARLAQKRTTQLIGFGSNDLGRSWPGEVTNWPWIEHSITRLRLHSMGYSTGPIPFRLAWAACHNSSVKAS